MRTNLTRLLVVLAGLAAAAFMQGGSSRAAQPLLVEPVVWQFDRDYPDSLPGDGELPIDTIYVKTHDATDWMATYDKNPNAIAGPESIQNVIDIYAQQGIEVAAWFVPKGKDYAKQLEMAKQVIDSGVTALYADLEPFQGFCYLDCSELARNFWIPLQQARPNARLGVIYDPRPWWWDQSATREWFTVADAALPMCYWESYTGQVPWMDPAGCVTQARNDLKTLSPGRSLDYIPMLQGDSTPPRTQLALDAAVRAESTRVSLWRRGVVSNSVWDMIAGYTEPDGPHCALDLVDGCLIREATQPAVYLVQGGAKFHIPNEATFVEMGFDWRDVQVVPLGLTRDIPDAPADGTLLTVFGEAGYSVVYGGARFGVASAEQLPALGLDAAKALVVPSVDEIPAVPNDFTRLKELSTADEFVTYGGSRIPLDADGLAALVALGRGAPSAFVVPDGALAVIPVAQVKYGDANCDNNVGVIDVILVLQRTIGVPQGGLCTHVAGDTDCDGLPLPGDALLILRFASGDPAETPEGCTPIGTAAPAALPTPPANPAEEPTDTPANGTTASPAPASATETPAPQSATPGVPSESPSATVTPTPVETPLPVTPTATASSGTATPTPMS